MSDKPISPFFAKRGSSSQQRDSTRRSARSDNEKALVVVDESRIEAARGQSQGGDDEKAASAPPQVQPPIQQPTVAQPPAAAPAPAPQPAPDDNAAQPDQDRRQRVRIDPTVSTANINGKTTPPLRAAEEIIMCHTASLQAGIATLLRAMGKEFINLAHRTYSKARNIERMKEDKSYIPISARLTFKLQATKEVEQLQGYRELQEQVNDDMSKVQKRLKEHIIACAQLEHDHLRAQLVKHVLLAIRDTVILFSAAHELDPKLNSLIGCTLISQYSKDILITDLKETPESLLAKYKAEHNITDNGESLPGSASLILPQLARVLHFVFYQSWTSYMFAHRQAAIALDLKKKAKQAMTRKTTEDTAMLVDGELPADREQLQQLVEKMANEIIDKREKEKAKTAGNEKRGKQPSASQKKKKGTDKSRSQTATKKQRVPSAKSQKAGDSDNDSQNDTRNKGTKRSNGQSNKKKGPKNSAKRQS